MKQIIKITVAVTLFLSVVSTSACKKDAITITTDRTYVEAKIVQTNPWFSGMILSLKTDGRATLIEEGDMATDGKYKIKGDVLTFNSNGGGRKLKFTIISDQEIHKDTGEQLFLSGQ